MWRLFRLSCVQRLIVACVAAMLTLTAPTPSRALIMVGRGNTPVSDVGWPAGTLDVANLKTRVGWYEGPPFGGGEWCFLYRGDLAALNEALKAFAAIRAPALQIVLHDGPANNTFLGDEKDPKSDTHYDWSFTVWVPASWHRLYNDPRSTFMADQPNFRQPVAPPRIDVYVTPKLDWKKVAVPEGVQVVDQRVGVQPPAKGALLKGDAFDMANAKPVPDVTITVETYKPDDKKQPWQTIASATGDKLGRYELANVPAGNARVVLAAPGYATRMIGYEQVKDGLAKKYVTDLSKAAKVSGTVLDTDGKPVPNVKVRADNVMGIDGRGYPIPERPETATDEKGQFTLDGLPTGYAQFFAHADNYFPLESLKLHAVPAERTVELRIVRTGAVKGVVLDRKTGKPTTAGGSIHVEGPGERIGKWGGSMNLAPDGTFEFKSVPPGPYTVSTQPLIPGLKPDPNQVQITVESGKTIEVTVKK
jgi:hypothetical protein